MDRPFMWKCCQVERPVRERGGSAHPWSASLWLPLVCQGVACGATLGDASRVSVTGVTRLGVSVVQQWSMALDSRGNQVLSCCFWEIPPQGDGVQQRWLMTLILGTMCLRDQICSPVGEGCQWKILFLKKRYDQHPRPLSSMPGVLRGPTSTPWRAQASTGQVWPWWQRPSPGASPCVTVRWALWGLPTKGSAVCHGAVL